MWLGVRLRMFRHRATTQCFTQISTLVSHLLYTCHPGNKAIANSWKGIFD